MQPFLQNKRVLITGGGGSIGSELCRQAAAQSPRELILLDINENGAFSVQQELLGRYGRSFPLRVEIASIRDLPRLEAVFAETGPEVVLHAAAHKHVPFMELNPGEAVKNNILGTWNLLQAAERAGSERLVFISTDKAVRPSSVMGASKRAAERLLLPGGTTRLAAVRFGNVADSAGSVLPLFRRQIAGGGPVTVTDPRMTRFFMTIPEAAGLVLDAARLAEGGELFVLDMGAPVSILALAEGLIREAGLEPHRDIPILYTGLRPGEKLTEELLTPAEQEGALRRGKILQTALSPFAPEERDRVVENLRRAAGSGSRREILCALREAVPDYCPKEEESPA